MHARGLSGWKQLRLATAGYVAQERTQVAHRKEPQDPAINLFFAFYAFFCGYADFCFICLNPRPSAVSPSLFVLFVPFCGYSDPWLFLKSYSATLP
jgi:hypothetical protein